MPEFDYVTIHPLDLIQISLTKMLGIFEYDYLEAVDSHWSNATSHLLPVFCMDFLVCHCSVLRDLDMVNTTPLLSVCLAFPPSLQFAFYLLNRVPKSRRFSFG
jgi:hypothetical protein